MARDYNDQPLTAMRRSDRGVTEEAWIKHFLQQAAVGTLAMTYEGQPFVNTNLFIYDADAHCIYTHTARVGRSRAIIEANPRVCFSLMEMGRMLPADEALEFSVEYAGVTVFGEASIIEDMEEATRILQMLLDKYAPHLQAGEDYRPPVPEELKRTSVFCIRIEEWSGKKKEVADDFPGAFWYPSIPALASLQALVGTTPNSTD
ncbi:pyridoxamine 5'-phosphate oxidase family protein [Phototrophicus methaneseepsis]|uniref:Pyridoxamine 5'-phosphate oxidase family protein n=1 Tax=Phototrophicus methaneseepsis TaxID=2710758 RepID=A0A7S8EAZ4_9CHLR|nr:pyridoxamine 5'-phosphate oxidase family protein [Phototrophicus methaneseepsis]QPC83524.1 pyridoxamine 5'-phosphate oxidase family protein [Phototrophicus methaneseepsis]